MTDRDPSPYRIIGIELSPYSVKVRSAFRYKGLPYQWLVRSSRSEELFQRYARLPLVPLVITPDGEALQDSTPILERLEEWVPEPSFHPEDPALAFLSALIEEYADEWVNKHMFHQRWVLQADRTLTAERLALATMPDASDPEIAKHAAAIAERMLGRLGFVGSNETTAPLIEASFENLLERIEAHLQGRRFLFGSRPCFADFGLAHQLYECSLDPTAGRRMRESTPHTLVWIERMLDPRPGGAFESWEALAPTLEPLLREEVAGRFLPWSDANARALAQGEDSFAVEIRGGAFHQGVQKYHARSLTTLRNRYRSVAGRSDLDPILERCGCLAWLAVPGPA